MLVVLSDVGIISLHGFFLGKSAGRNTGGEIKFVHGSAIEAGFFCIHRHAHLFQSLHGIFRFHRNHINAQNDVRDLLQKSGDEPVIQLLGKMGDGHTLCKAAIDLNVRAFEVEGVGADGAFEIIAQALAFGRILDDLGRVVQHAGQQRGHELARVVALEVGGLERDIGVAGRVRFVEGIGRERDHLVVDLVRHLFGNAVFDAAGAFLAGVGAAVDKVGALGLHDLELFLAHGAADIVGLAEAEARQLAADLHDLLLVDDAAVGDVEDMRELRRFVADFVRFAAVAQVGGDGVHRAGAVQRDQGDDVLEVFRAHAGQHLGHAGGFKLEDTLGLAAGQHCVGGGVVVVDALVRKRGLFLLHGGLGVADDGQRAQAEEVHFKQAEALDLGHVELCDRHAVVGAERDIFGRGFARDDDAGRVRGRVARHALDGQRGLDQLVHLRVGFVEGLQVGRDLQRAAQRHLELHRDQLGDLVDVLVRHAHDAADVAHGGAGGHGAEGDDLRDMVAAVFFVDVVDDFLAALVAEVDVKVGHRDALGVQKAFKDEAVADRVNVGDADAVGGQAARARTAPGADRDAAALGVVDEIVDDEVVVGVPHLADDADLIVKALAQLGRDMAGVTAFEAVAAELFKIDLVVQAVGGFEIRQLGLAEVEVKLALFGDFVRVFAGFGRHREQIVHLVGAFDIEFVGLELHAVGVGDGLAGLDAQQDALHLGVLAPQIVRVVGSDKGDAGLARKADELRQHDVVFLQAVVLQLDIIVAGAEQVVVVQRRLFGALVIARKDGLRHFARKAGGQADEALVVGFEQVFVDARLGVEAFKETGRDHFDQVLVAGLVFAQQHKVVVAVDAVDLVKAGAGGDIDLAADDGADARGNGGVIKLHTAVHDAVVGDGDGGLAQLLDAVEQFVDAAGAVQQAVLCVQVQVGELAGGWFSHGVPFPARRPRTGFPAGAGRPAGCA